MISTKREAIYQFAAVTVGVLAVLGTPLSIAVAAASGMMFDPPGASDNLELRAGFGLMICLPVVVAATIPLALNCYKRPDDRHAAWMTGPLAVWIVAAFLLFSMTEYKAAFAIRHPEPSKADSVQ